MLNIHTLTLGLYQTNCYIVHQADSDRCVVIDPGYDANKILAFLQEKNLQPDAILLTHGHFDHVGAVKDLAADTDCKVYINSLEHTMPHTMTAGQLYSTDDYTDRFSVAGMDVTVLHTPGHTPGSVCLIIEDAIPSLPVPAVVPTCLGAIGQPFRIPSVGWQVCPVITVYFPVTLKLPLWRRKNS